MQQRTTNSLEAGSDGGGGGGGTSVALSLTGGTRSGRAASGGEGLGPGRGARACAAYRMGSQKPLLCPWLIKQVDSCQYPGLHWVNEGKQQFRIPWKHCLRQNISADDTKIFEAWATASGRYKPGIDVPNPPVWKRNFRSALARKKHFRRVRDNRSDPHDPHLVYEIQSTDYPEGNSPTSSTDRILKPGEDEEEEEVSEEDMEGVCAGCRPSPRSASITAIVKVEETPLEEPVKPGASGLRGEMEPVAQAAWRESPHSSTAAEDSREGSDREMFKRRLVQMQGQMLGSLSNLSVGVCEMGRSLEASVSNLAQEILSGQGNISSSMEAMRSSVSAGNESVALQRLMDRVSTSLETQEEAIRGLRGCVEIQGGPGRALLAVSRERALLAREQRDAAREHAAVMQEQRDAAREQAAVVQEQRDAAREQAAVMQEQRDAAREQAAVVQGQRDAAREQAAVLQEQRDAAREQAAVMQEQRDASREGALLQREHAAQAREQRDAAREHAVLMQEQRGAAREQAAVVQQQRDAAREQAALMQGQRDAAREQLAAQSGRRKRQPAQERLRRAALRPRLSSSRAKPPACLAAADGNKLELRLYQEVRASTEEDEDNVSSAVEVDHASLPAPPNTGTLEVSLEGMKLFNYSPGQRLLEHGNLSTNIPNCSPILALPPFDLSQASAIGVGILGTAPDSAWAMPPQMEDPNTAIPSTSQFKAQMKEYFPNKELVTEFEVSIHYRGRVIANEVVKNTNGLRFSYNSQSDFPYLHDVRFPTTASTLMSDQQQVKYTNQMLERMDQGLTVEVQDNLIIARRYGRCRAFWSMGDNPTGLEPQQISNRDVTVLYSQADFNKDMCAFLNSTGGSPQYSIWLCFGELWPDPNGKPWNKKMIVVKVTPVTFRLLHELAHGIGASSLRSEEMNLQLSDHQLSPTSFLSILEEFMDIS
ncbi:uncharacterized protein LOC116966805 [Amblyraja radiata]|uniref:uncharacterized protein LOC116966805 n=1 Tax=Amblyraja radiata TaxID=386614 RepID=UPI001402F880|nr:uncharacterized protein LOC116966805 [Amblyraja radiata]